MLLGVNASKYGDVKLRDKVGYILGPKISFFIINIFAFIFFSAEAANY